MKSKALFKSYNLLLGLVLLTGPAFTTAPKTGMVHIEGAYQGKKGSKDPLTCYGSNVGYIMTDEGKRTALCFDRLPGAENLSIDCDPIWVEGKLEEKRIEKHDACPSGSMQILYVERWSCL